MRENHQKSMTMTMNKAITAESPVSWTESMDTHTDPRDSATAAACTEPVSHELQGSAVPAHGAEPVARGCAGEAEAGRVERGGAAVAAKQLPIITAAHPAHILMLRLHMLARIPLCAHTPTSCQIRSLRWCLP